MKIQYDKNYSKFSDLKPGDVYRFACSDNLSFYLCYHRRWCQRKEGHINLSTSLEYYHENSYDVPVIIYNDAKLVIGKE